MDVRLLSGMIGELMLETDSLSLPGIGTFTAEEMPASFSDKGYTVNPPYRRLSFTSAQVEDDRLAALYAASNQGLSLADASSIISSFCVSLSEELKSRKSVDLPGLGRLRSTREGQLFFVADPDLDISPDACGLTSVSLKTHSLSVADLPELDQKPSETIPEQPKSQNRDQKPLETIPEEPKTQNLDQNLAKSIPEPEMADQVGHDEAATGHDEAALGHDAPAPAPKPAKTPATAPARKQRKPKSKAFKWTVGLLSAAAVLLVAFVVVSRLAPDFTDKLLYTPEQLEILNTPIEDGTGLPG